MEYQLSIFEEDNILHRLRDARWIQHSGEDKCSIVDVVIAFTKRDYDSARKHWNDIKYRLNKDGSQLVDFFDQLKLEAADGKKRLTDVAGVDVLFRIVQEIPGAQASIVKDWLAERGKQAIEDEADPERAAIRWQGKVSRKAFIAALAEAVISMPKYGYGVATNDIYRGLFQRTTEQLRRQLETDQPREKMSAPALGYLHIAEWIAARRLGEATEVTFSEARQIIQNIAEMIGAQVYETERRMGIDVVTGRKLLGPIDAIRGN